MPWRRPVRSQGWPTVRVKTHRGSIPPLRRCGWLCCPAWCRVGSRHAMASARAVTGLAHCACEDTQGFDSSSPALRLAVLPSMVPRRQPPCHGVGPCGHRAGLVWCGHTQRLESASPQLPPCCAGPLPNGVSRNFGVLKGSARLCGRCLRGNCPLSSAARRSKFKNAGVSRAGART